MTIPSDITNIFILAALAFVVAMIGTPILTNLLYKHKMGKRIREGETPIYSRMHKGKEGTPVGGGILVWMTVLVLAIAFSLLGHFTNIEFFKSLDFLDRGQTWLPIAALVATALVFLLDDYLNIRGIGPFRGGLRARYKILILLAIATVGALWFFFKLDFDVLHVPFVGDFNIGWWYIPLFIFVTVGTANAVNLTDGLDGLSGGTLLPAFFAYTAFAIAQGRLELAAFLAVIMGALLAFLWFNIYPARFFMGDTGSISLGLTLAIVAFLTNRVLLLPIIGLVFVLETASVIIQVASKKIRHKKIFLSTPLHHHFEALGWPETKVTMRFWVIAAIMAVIGVAFGVLGHQ